LNDNGYEYSVIFGRAVKNEYLTLATFFTTGAIAYAAASRGSKQKPASESLPLQQAVPINAGSRCVAVFFQ
jgi:ATP synthase subunit K